MSSRILLVFAVCFAFSGQSDSQETKRKPNIVILLADDLGYADLSMHGSKQIKTPHIDTLAKSGVRFTNGYVSAPYCSPTRAGLLTGRYQQRFGHEFNPVVAKNGGKDGLPLDQHTIADYLRAAGYVTGLFGKWHLGETADQHPQSRGFDDFFGFLTGMHSYTMADDKEHGPLLRGRKKAELNGYLTDVLAKESTQFIERNKAKPFLLYLAFNAVHTPMEAPEPAEKEFANIKDAKRRTYLAMIRKMDDAIGQVMAKLRELNLEEDTLIFFLGDNGGPMTRFAANGSLNFPLRGSKGDTFEGGIRVPFVIAWKGRLPAGKVDDRLVISLDILPTALAAAKSTSTANVKLDGVNLLPFLNENNTTSPHVALYWRFGSQMAIRQGDWVLVRASLGEKEYENISKAAMLFNLKEDIGQQRDLAKTNPDRVVEMQRAWDRWNADLAQPRWPATFKGAIFKNP
ncbi:MAG: sulfatase [Gemmataceae bacterium]|nr:sulfatase [Gemmataceae bacterium]